MYNNIETELPWINDRDIDLAYNHLLSSDFSRRDAILLSPVNLSNIVAREKYDTNDNYSEKIKVDIGVNYADFKGCLTNGVIIFPIHGPYFDGFGNHWSLLLFCGYTNIYYHFDSLPGSPNRGSAINIANIINRYFNVGCNDKKEIYYEMQHSTWECGYFILRLTEIIMKGKEGPIDIGFIKAYGKMKDSYSFKKCLEIREFLDTQMILKQYNKINTRNINLLKRKREEEMATEKEEDCIDSQLRSSTTQVKSRIKLMAQFDDYAAIFSNIYGSRIGVSTEKTIQKYRKSTENKSDYWKYLMQSIYSGENSSNSADDVIAKYPVLQALVKKFDEKKRVGILEKCLLCTQRYTSRIMNIFLAQQNFN